MEMDQPGMWEKKRKKKNSTSSDDFPTNKASSYDDSWEEQAFAEDAAGHLGAAGCVWPPRSYSCSFCKREFRSAQALGGHMNVHRRDRARLKHESLFETHQIPAKSNPFTPLTDNLRHPISQQLVRDLVFNPNPKSSSSWFSTLPKQNLEESDLRAKRNIVDSTEIAHSSILFHKWYQNTEATNDLRGEQETYRSQQKVQTVNSTDDKDDSVCCKRKRTDAPSVAFFLRSSALGEHYVKSEVLGLSPSSIDDLDLELRLGGGRPKPKIEEKFHNQI